MDEIGCRILRAVGTGSSLKLNCASDAFLNDCGRNSARSQCLCVVGFKANSLQPQVAVERGDTQRRFPKVGHYSK